MISATVKGSVVPVIAGQIALLEQGRSFGAVELAYDGPTPNTFEALTLDDGEGNQLVGAVVGGVQVGGRLKVQLVLGSGRMGQPIAAKHYRQVDARQVVSDVVSASGERLAGSTPKGMRLIHWSRSAGAGGPSLTQICQRVGWIWRTLADGTIWAGPRAYALANSDALLIDQSAAARTASYKPNKFDLRPATTLLVDGVDRNVLRVEYRISENLDAIVWY